MHVVVGILKNVHHEILIAERPRGKTQAGAWEFPGGKVEPNETPLEALVREFQEEVGALIIAAKPWRQFQYAYADLPIFLDCWAIEKYTGTPVGKEGQAIAWAHPNCLSQFNFLQGNRPIIEMIQIEHF